MIKSNWLIKNLIMSLDLIFMKIHPVIIQFDLEFVFFFFIIGYNGVQLGFKFPLKLQLVFLKSFSVCFLRVASLYFIFYFEKEK